MVCLDSRCYCGFPSSRQATAAPRTATTSPITRSLPLIHQLPLPQGHRDRWRLFRRRKSETEHLVLLALLLGGRVLVLLVLGDEIVHVGLGLGELHLVHALASVPVEEGLAAEHRSELLGDTLHHLLH